MAQPIKETPVLVGADAKRFDQEVKENENKKVTPEEFKRGRDAYRALNLPEE